MPAPDWSRPDWDRDEAKAMLLYFVFGTFAPGEIRLDLTAHGTPGLPPGIEMRRIQRAVLAHWDGHPLHGALGDMFRTANPAAFEAARKAPECLVVRGELADQDSLGYLRDTLGVVTALFDAGAVVVIDPQILEIFDRDAWRDRYGGDERAAPRSHVAILCSDDRGGDAWIHTRGMRKFARPDVSIRAVPKDDARRAGALAARLVEMQARGMRFGDGSTVAIEGLPADLRVKRGGSLDDPEFNNTHLEMTWPVAS